MPNRNIEGDTEGFGMVFLEAAACGKPTVAGRAGGTGSAVIDGVTGLCVNGGSANDVAEGLVRVLGDSSLAKKLGLNGLERSRDCSWERVAEKTRYLHRSLAER
jgi:phosphatidylinositol alpha-1,6-mannosyltransferase